MSERPLYAAHWHQPYVPPEEELRPEPRPAPEENHPVYYAYESVTVVAVEPEPRPPTPDPECPVKGCQIPVDIFVTAVDGARFGSHKATLQTCNHQLYQRIIDCESNNEVMPHEAEILVLLLAFAHVDVEQPNLRELGFEVFEEFSVQVEEYKIEVARQACSLRMEAFAESKAFEVFRYATKYRYTFLSDKAAPFTVNETVQRMYKNLDPETFALWVLYRDEWAMNIRRKIAAGPVVQQHRVHQSSSNTCGSIHMFHNTVIKPIFQYGDGKASAVPSNKASSISILGNCADCREAALAWEKGITEFKMRLFSTFVI